MSARRLASANSRLAAQLAWVFDRDATAMEIEARKSGMLDTEVRSEVTRLRDVACELEAAAMCAGYEGYPFGDEVP